MKSARVIFLDFDGVLNSAAFLQKNPYAKSAHQRGELVFDPAAMGILNDLCRSTRAAVVISSDWRKRYGHDVLARMLADAGFQHRERVVGQTPDMGSAPRGFEIYSWLMLRKPVSRVVILDDRADMEPLEKKLVQTNPVVGLTKGDAVKAAGILK